MEVDVARKQAHKAIGAVKRCDLSLEGWEQVWERSFRVGAEVKLPEYYRVYFLLVDLLQFDRFGPRDKLAWSIPVELRGNVYLINHEKMGTGVFAVPGVAEDVETHAKIIVRLIRQGVEKSEKYFDWRARQAIASGSVSVINLSNRLFDRYIFLLEQYWSKCDEANQRHSQRDEQDTALLFLGIDPEQARLRQEAEWLAFSVIESFFSWTEHIFIHLSILLGKCKNADEVATLASGRWSEKFWAALDKGDDEAKLFHKKLLTIRQQFRNLGTHGAFGKKREAFIFHSETGAVPVTLPNDVGRHSYRFGGGLDYFRTDVPFVGQKEIATIEEFIEYLRSGQLVPAWVYLDGGLDTGLTAWQLSVLYAAMESPEAMEDLVGFLSSEADKVANMEF